MLTIFLLDVYNHNDLFVANRYRVRLKCIPPNITIHNCVYAIIIIMCYGFHGSTVLFLHFEQIKIKIYDKK